MGSNTFSHLDKKGNASMVDVSSKKETSRSAEAFGEVILGEKVFNSLVKNEIEKGDVLSVARIAGIQAAKKTSELIPLCHNIFLSGVEIKFNMNKKNRSVEIRSKVKTVSVTGVEMEALTSVTVAALTVYDMCKALDRSIQITNIHLLKKSGGKSGDFVSK